MKKTKIYLVPHTHWDKEWYFTKWTSQVYLNENLNKIYDYFKEKPNMSKFVFDSQFSIVDDFIELNIENKKKIKEMVEADKLVVSPWYTQTDTFNVSGESIVRNMLTGIKESEKLGNYMKIAYLPDTFGFNANLPQIFKSFNMKGFIHWRGVKRKQIENNLFNSWKGIDGSEIFEYNLFKYGYSCGGIFMYKLFCDGYEKNDTKNNAMKLYDIIKNDENKLLDTLKKMSTDKILFPFGTDQIAYFENLEEMILELNNLDNEHEWIITSYEEFIDMFKNEIELSKLKTIEGELRYGQYSRVHKTINSARWDIKSKIKKLEYLIFNVVEPLSVFGSLLKIDYNQDVIHKALKLLFECQAHDSAGGCNTDETNNSIIERLKSAIDMIETLKTLLLRQISYKKKINENDILIFNPLPYQIEKKFTMKVFTKTKNFKIYDDMKNELNYRIINQKTISQNNFVMKENLINKEQKYDDEVFWTDIEIQNIKLNSFSIKKIIIKEVQGEINYKILKNNFIENDFFKITFENNEIEITNKETKKIFKNAIYLESDFDAGDSYDFSPINFKEEKTSKLVSTNLKIIESNSINSMNVQYEFLVPKNLKSSKNVSQKILLKINLDKDFIDLEIDMINKASDIRWRIIFETDIKSEFSNADTSFGVIKRSYDYSEERNDWVKEEWNDYPIDIEAMESCVWLEENQRKCGVLTNGNNEYQIIGQDKNKIAVTLFRAYSLIGRKDLVYRPGRASGIEQYPHETPDSNFIDKKIYFKLRSTFDSTKNLVKAAKEWCIEDTYYQKQNINKFFARGQMFVLPTKNVEDFKLSESILELPKLDSNLIVSSLKKEYDGTKIIMRLYNPTEKSIDIKELNRFNFLNTLEQQIEPKDIVEPNEFITIELKGCVK